MAKRRKRSNLIIIILVLIIAALAAFVAIRNQNKPKGEKVFTEKVTKRTITERVAASGKVFPQTEVKISSDVSGEIVELYVEEGDSVVAGAILAKIDPDAYESQVERGMASVNSAKAQEANAQSQIENLIAQKEQIEAQLVNAKEVNDRNKKLHADGVISDADYETSISNLKALEANLRSSDASIKAAKESARAAAFTVKSNQASLKELKTSLNRTTIYAPTNGIISMLSVEQGERVVGTIQMQGTEMMRLADLNAMEVRVEVSENDIPRVSLNDEVEIEVDAYLNRTFKGKVTQIANSANNSATATSLTSDQVTNFEVRINIDPNSYLDLITPTMPYPFRPGMSASVEIKTNTRKEVFTLPIQAVTVREPDQKNNKEEVDDDANRRDFLEVVFVVAGDTVQQREVMTGIQDDEFIEVTKGLDEGEEVVKGPYSAVSRKLKNGDKVQVTSEDKVFGEDNN